MISLECGSWLGDSCELYSLSPYPWEGGEVVTNELGGLDAARVAGLAIYPQGGEKRRGTGPVLISGWDILMRGVEGDVAVNGWNEDWIGGGVLVPWLKVRW